MSFRMHTTEKLPQKNSSKTKFDSPILEFGAACLKKSTGMNFYKQHIITTFYLSFQLK